MTRGRLGLFVNTVALIYSISLNKWALGSFSSVLSYDILKLTSLLFLGSMKLFLNSSTTRENEH